MRPQMVLESLEEIFQHIVTFITDNEKRLPKDENDSRYLALQAVVSSMTSMIRYLSTLNQEEDVDFNVLACILLLDSDINAENKSDNVTLKEVAVSTSFREEMRMMEKDISCAVLEAIRYFVENNELGNVINTTVH